MSLMKLWQNSKAAGDTRKSSKSTSKSNDLGYQFLLALSPVRAELVEA
jgi:hypothetical protein